MQIKGTSIISMKKFVYQRFGQDGLDRLLAGLPQGSKELLGGTVLANNWYPARDGMFVPTEAVCRLFYGGDPKGAWEVGAFSAQDSLRGIYRFFVRIATVPFLLQKTSSVFSTYYTPGKMEVAENTPRRILLRMTGVDESHPLFEARVAGYLHGALQVCGNEDHTVAVGASIARGDAATEFIIDLP
ncbi:MAG: hypothetical protein EG828_06670 [Deltaproteobacteria bacterium]|nr:hypothetical protein [Deltaproteobacteria bacterium]